MGQVLHGCATTTDAVRRAIQHSQKSLRALASQYGINQKTVAKWRKRSSAADLATGPKSPIASLSTQPTNAGTKHLVETERLWKTQVKSLPNSTPAGDASHALRSRRSMPRLRGKPLAIGAAGDHPERSKGAVVELA
jgi:hypothetical protein